MRRPVGLFFGWVVAASLALTGVIEPRASLGALQAAADTPASHHAAGMAHLQAGRMDEALAEFRAAVRLDRNYLPSLLQMADLLSSRDRVFEAYGVLQHAATVAPASAEVHALLGRCFLGMEKLKEARDEMRRALELNPELSEPHLALGVVESRQGRPGDARRHIGIYLQRAPRTVAAQELLARICFEMKDYDAALGVYAELRKANPARANIQTEIARTLLAAGRYAEAEQAYRAALEQKPADRDVLHGLFESSYKRGAYEQAIEAMQQLLKLEPQSCEPLLNLVRAYRMMNQFARARQQAERCIQLDSTHASAHFLLGRIWFGDGDLVRAKTDLEQAAKSDPNSVEALYWLAMVELRLGERGSALRRLERAASVDPEHAGVRYALALEYARQNRPADAKKQFEQFGRLKSRERWKSQSSDDAPSTMARAAPSGAADAAHLNDWIGFANYLLQENKPRDALLVLQKALQLAPENVEALTLAAAAYTETGEIDPALAAYAEAEKYGPTALLFLGRGTLYRRLGEGALALADLRRALSMELPARKAAAAHIELASLLNEMKLHRDAEVELRRAAELDPNNAAARVMLGWTLVELGKPAEGAAECRRALEQDPSDASAQLGLARALLEQKRAADAGAQIERAAAIEGESGRVLLARGRLAAAQGMSRLAIDYLNRAGQADPSQAEAFYFLGIQLLASRRLSEAAVAFEKATIIDPAHAESWLELGKIYLEAKRSQAAVGYFQKSVTAAPDNAEAHYGLALALVQTAQFAEAEQAARRAKALGHPTADALLQSLAGRTAP